MRFLRPPVIAEGTRTPIGRFGGGLAGIDAHDLGGLTIRVAPERWSIPALDVDEVVIGQVGQVGPDAYNARRCALAAGLSPSTTARNADRLCGSRLQAVVNRTIAGARRSIRRRRRRQREHQQAPFLEYDGRDGGRLGPSTTIYGTLLLVTDPFKRYPMGATAEVVAARYDIDHSSQDAFARQSQRRAEEAIEAGHYHGEIVPVPLEEGSAFEMDEHPRSETTAESLAKLKSGFRDGATVRAGNSGINERAAAVVPVREAEARAQSLADKLRLRSWAVRAIEPEVMGYAPADAIPAALAGSGVMLDDIVPIELNEAFAAQAVAVARATGLDIDRANVDRGAIALGRPVGATGAILTAKLQHALERANGKLGLISMCIGGGQGVAAVVERPDPTV